MPHYRHRHLVNRALEKALGLSEPETTFHRQVLKILDECLRSDTEEPTIGTLPLLTCQVNDGDVNLAISVLVAWQIILLAVKMLDDVEDDQVDQAPVVTNMATGLLYVAQLLLEELAAQGVSPARVQRLRQSLDHTMLRACAGQHSDLMVSQNSAEYIDPESWLAIAGAKSGEFFAWAAWAGALVSGADEPVLVCFREYGYHMGVLKQVIDDFNDVWFSDGTSDLATGSPSLPVCYAWLVTKEEQRDHLRALLQRAGDGDKAAEAQAQQLLTDVGAQHYLLIVARTQYQRAVAALRRANLNPLLEGQLVALLDEVMPAATLRVRNQG